MTAKRKQLDFTGPGCSGLEIVTDMVANTTNIFSLATKKSGSVATLVTRFLCDMRFKLKE